MANHECITECYYLERLWLPGEILEKTPGYEDAPPNRHFREVGMRASASEERTKHLPKSAGDDPRSTVALVKALKGYGVTPEEGLPRKQIFSMLYPHEQAEAIKAVTVAPEVPEDDVIYDDPDIPGGPVSMMDPDTLDKTPLKKLAAMIYRDRGVKKPYSGISKVSLFEADADLALSQTDNA